MISFDEGVTQLVQALKLAYHSAESASGLCKKEVCDKQKCETIEIRVHCISDENWDMMDQLTKHFGGSPKGKEAAKKVCSDRKSFNCKDDKWSGLSRDHMAELFGQRWIDTKKPE